MAVTTFLFTDIEGSTRLWETHPGAMHAAPAAHHQTPPQPIDPPRAPPLHHPRAGAGRH